ncbi:MULTISPECIES: glutathione S-transferase family protein [Marinobacter]|uniref:glutathione S-transferase family protein n=1 Tax=Marinobacter TaxID=2742 RepID=UPI0012452E56|nr:MULTISPECIES: glutathione S-transferase family protein [Marinobacter]MBL3556925.1 glutathione S-transferase family protein [Marinobacter sp. JB05H06]
MKPVLFYGVPSGCSFGSIVALEWLGIPYQLCRINMPEDVTSEEYRRINPMCETPALMMATGNVITESMAILNHLGAMSDDQKLNFAKGTVQFDRLNQALAFLNTTFFNAFSPLWFDYENGLDNEEKRVLTQYGIACLEKAYADLERFLGNKPWLLGEDRSLADAYFSGIARWSEYHPVIDFQAYPRVQQLYKKLLADPAVQFAQSIEEGSPTMTRSGFSGEISLCDVLILMNRGA